MEREPAVERLRGDDDAPLVLPLSMRLRALADQSEQRARQASSQAERLAERGRLAGLRLAQQLAEGDEARRVAERVPAARKSQAVVGTRPWSRTAACCVDCGTNERRHYARGRCYHCWYRQYWLVRPDREQVLAKMRKRRLARQGA